MQKRFYFFHVNRSSLLSSKQLYIISNKSKHLGNVHLFQLLDFSFRNFAYDFKGKLKHLQTLFFVFDLIAVNDNVKENIEKGSRVIIAYAF